MAGKEEHERIPTAENGAISIGQSTLHTVVSKELNNVVLNVFCNVKMQSCATFPNVSWDCWDKSIP
jgi:hypothetical protein